MSQSPTPCSSQRMSVRRPDLNNSRGQLAQCQQALEEMQTTLNRMFVRASLQQARARLRFNPINRGNAVGVCEAVVKEDKEELGPM